MANQYSPPRSVTDTHKECSWCGIVKPHSDFHKDKNSPSGLAYYCMVCAIEKSKAHHHKHIKGNPEYARKKRNGWIKQRHGISLEEYEKKLQVQGSVCSICKIPLQSSGFQTHLDHDHVTGKLRDFLCTNCNRGLGHFQDNKTFLSNAIEYLERHK